MKKEILRINHITCAKNGQIVLNDLSMQVFEGEIYGILRLERHGGIELINLIEWNDEIQAGQVFFQDRLVNDIEISDGSRNKVTVISKESRLIDSLTLADNIFVIRPGFRKFYIPERVLRTQTKLLLNEHSIHLSPSTCAGELKAYDRLVTELLRAVVAGDRLVLLLDIPDLLGSEELAEFHRLMNKLAQNGITFLYIYNHHEALRNFCDRIAIFQGGRIAKVVEKNEPLEDHVKVFAKFAYEEMSLIKLTEEMPSSEKESILQFDHVNWGGLKDFCLNIPSGENLLLIDQNNTVLNDLMKLFSHLNQGNKIKGVSTPQKTNNVKIGIIQRPPIRATLFQDMSFIDNLCFSLGEKFPRLWRKSKFLKSVIREYKDDFGDLLNEKQLYDLHTQELYSVAYYRHLIAKPDLVVCFQPLSGQDMYLRPHILRLITKLRQSGISVLILSTDYYDTIYVADRIVCIENGKVAAEKTREKFQDMHILHQRSYVE